MTPPNNPAKPSSPFDITRRDPAGNASARYPGKSITLGATGTTYDYRGKALGAGGPDTDGVHMFVPAEPTNFVGHLTRDVVVGGLTLADRVFGRTSPTAVGLAGPFTAGEEVTVEKAHEVEVEGANLIMTSGVQAISGATPIGTKLTFLEGCFATQVQANGDIAYYTLTENGLSSSDGTSLRIRAEKV